MQQNQRVVKKVSTIWISAILLASLALSLSACSSTLQPQGGVDNLQVSAGDPQTITLPSAASLRGTIGKHGGGTLKLLWSKTEGPGSVSFADAHAQSTTASFSKAGDYLLELTASIGTQHGSSEVAITVEPASSDGGSGSQFSTAAWSNHDIGNTTLPGATTIDGTDAVLKGSGADIWGTSDGFQFAYQQLNSNGQIITVVNNIQNTSSWAKAGLMMRASLNGDAVQVSILHTAGSTTLLEYRTQQGGWTYDGPGEDPDNHAFANYDIPEPTWLKLTREGKVFTGYRSSDGREWELVGQATLDMPETIYVGLAVTSHNPEALAEGQFDNISLISDQVSGGGSSGSDPGNQAPQVSAGDDQTVTLPDSASLQGSASDDGLPDGKLTTTWSEVSGPGPVGFDDASSPETTASFSEAGSYVLKLTADDGQLSSSDEVTVTVKAQTLSTPQADYYIATNGSDSNNCTSVNSPCKTLNHVDRLVQPGDLVYIRGGTYYITSGQEIFLTRGGSKDHPVTWESYPGERAVFDGSRQDRSSASARRMMFWVIGSYQTFRNFDVTRSARDGIYINGGEWGEATHIVLDGIHAYKNDTSGISVQETNNSTIENCVAYGNADAWNPAAPYNNADGIHISDGDDNTIKNNLVYNNSDDGIDVWGASNTTIEYNISHDNGYDLSGQMYESDSASNGFKLGEFGAAVGGGHTVIGNISYHNTGFGFMDNATQTNNPITAYNNTSYNDSTNISWGRGFSFGGHGPHATLINNLGIPGPATIATKYNAILDSTSKTNNWDLGIVAADFISTDPNSPDFLRLASNSPAVSAGTDVGLSYSGSAPDLGALQEGQTLADIGPRHAETASVQGTVNVK